jgi:diacylglycerol diphosphate phosphatase/phosphatidate phosphatase
MMQRNVPQLTPQPVTFKDGEIVYPQFAYPLRNEIVPIWAAALLAFFVPFVVFLICSIRVRSFWDINNATIGLLYSLIVAAVFQVFIKWLIGGMFCPLSSGVSYALAQH